MPLKTEADYIADAFMEKVQNDTAITRAELGEFFIAFAEIIARPQGPVYTDLGDLANTIENICLEDLVQ